MCVCISVSFLWSSFLIIFCVHLNLLACIGLAMPGANSCVWMHALEHFLDVDISLTVVSQYYCCIAWQALIMMAPNRFLCMTLFASYTFYHTFSCHRQS